MIGTFTQSVSPKHTRTHTHTVWRAQPQGPSAHSLYTTHTQDITFIQTQSHDSQNELWGKRNWSVRWSYCADHKVRRQVVPRRGTFEGHCSPFAVLSLHSVISTRRGICESSQSCWRHLCCEGFLSQHHTSFTLMTASTFPSQPVVAHWSVGPTINRFMLQVICVARNEDRFTVWHTHADTQCVWWSRREKKDVTEVEHWCDAGVTPPPRPGRKS